MEDRPSRRAIRTPRFQAGLKDVGENVVSWREMRGWSQAKAARRMHLRLSFLRQIEAGTVKPRTT